jgi:hypothetical protein
VINSVVFFYREEFLNRNQPEAVTEHEEERRDEDGMIWVNEPYERYFAYLGSPAFAENICATVFWLSCHIETARLFVSCTFKTCLLGRSRFAVFVPMKNR